MKFDLIKLSQEFWEWIVGAFALTSIRSKFGRWAFKKAADILAKPLYDLLVRKGYIKLKKASAKKAEEDLQNAKTKTEIDSAIDNLP